MENQFLCDIYSNNYEQYIKQSILFSKKVNIMYPVIEYDRTIDREWQNDKIGSLKKYAGFDNVNLIPLKGRSDRTVDFNGTPELFKKICSMLNLSPIERECFLRYRNAEFKYLVLNGDRPTRQFCGYMHDCFNVAIEYIDMLRLFCTEYSRYQGNVLSNNDFLYSLLSSERIKTENIKSFSTMSLQEIFDINRNVFTGEYCDECRKNTYHPITFMNQIDVHEKAIEILIPDYSSLEVEDLYEIRLEAKSEIEQLAEYIDGISVVAHDEEELDCLIKRKINPAVEELKSKVKSMHWTTVQNCLKLRNVAAVPILITLLPDLPGYIPIGLSALLIAADIGIEMRKEYLHIEQDPLYFTIKLNKLARKQKEDKRNHWD